MFFISRKIHKSTNPCLLFGFHRREDEREFWKEKMRSSELFELKTKMDSDFSHYGSSPHRLYFVSRPHKTAATDHVAESSPFESYFFQYIWLSCPFIWFLNWVLSKFEFWYINREQTLLLLQRLWRFLTSIFRGHGNNIHVSHLIII